MRYVVAVLAAVTLQGCANVSPGVSTSASTSVYALGVGLDTAEKIATTYAISPLADPTVVVLLKSDAAAADATIHPLVANGNNISADELTLAQAALAKLTADMAANGVK